MPAPRGVAPGLLLVLIGCAAAGAGAETGPPPRGARSTACQEHADLHRRLDVVEKGVENTVEKLEAELAALLEAIDAPQWRPLLDNRGETMVDILQDPDQRPRS
ncbi:placenta-specific protein 9-like [Menidia menidia]